VLPAGERELVSDIGARYAPEILLGTSRALALRPELERGALAPGGGAFHLRLALRSTATPPSSRPHLSVHLVLDTSGSMSGEPIDRARRAAQALADRLAPTDDLSLTTFSSDARGHPAASRDEPERAAVPGRCVPARAAALPRELRVRPRRPSRARDAAGDGGPIPPASTRAREDADRA
jgi:Ca-activated chloride channel homolog